MDALLYAFWRILLLRSGPQSVPASATLMWLALLLHFAVGLVQVLFSLPFGYALFFALVSTLTMVAVVHTLLVLFRRQPRYLQSVTALAACETLLGILFLPLSLLYLVAGEAMDSLFAVIWLLSIGWNVAVAAHIFRHALGVSTWLGFLFSIAYLMLAITLGDIIGMAGVNA